VTPGIAAAALGASALAAALVGPFPGERGSLPWRFRDWGQAASLRELARQIPANASVSAQTGIVPHLSQRQVEWEFPRLENAEFVVLEEGGMVSAQGVAAYQATVESLTGLGYVEGARAGTITLYRRSAAAMAP
jgi:hypothetical protein